MKSKKIIIIPLIVCICIIGITTAYFLNSHSTNNQFITLEYGAVINDTFVSPNNWEPGDVTEKVVYATNTGETDMAVRISYQEEWESADGTTLANTQNGESIALINLTNTEDWVKIGNYYYYKYRLKPDEITSTFMESITFNDEVDFSSNCEMINTYYSADCSYATGDYYGASYSLDITVETIQFDKYKAVWGSTIDIQDEKPAARALALKSNAATVTNYSSGNTHEMYTFNHPATAQTGALTDYRYIGNDPYNYVYFNCDTPQEGVQYNYANSCEVWRILGVFSVERPDPTDNTKTITEQRIKLVRGKELLNQVAWNSNGDNDWSISSLKNYLNVDYYFDLTSSAKEQIEDAIFYLGGITNDIINETFGTTEQIYNQERGNVVYNNLIATKWNGKVALMYPSDHYMTYANGVDLTCYTNPYNCLNGSPNNSWIYNGNIRDSQSNIETFTDFLSPSALNSSDVFFVKDSGRLITNEIIYEYGVRPVVYLTSDVLIKSGSGQSTNPYVLSK